MFRWYRRAQVCYAYLKDVKNVSDLNRSTWFQRGWTLQELLGPGQMTFWNNEWKLLGSRSDLRHTLAHASGIDEACLAGQRIYKSYSVAQRMSWASHRNTTRVEDEAYCLLGLFDVSLPLLYGEGHDAFQRLQEAIMARGDDNSLFAWGLEHHDCPVTQAEHPPYKRPFSLYRSLHPPSPRSFANSRNVQKGFATHRILFEMTNRGMMVLIHRSYNPDVLDDLLESAQRHLDDDDTPSIGITLPLGCFKYHAETDTDRLNRLLGDEVSFSDGEIDSYFLCLVLDDGKWRRAHVTSHADPGSFADYTGTHYFAYENDYVRIYVHHDRTLMHGAQALSEPLSTWLHILDVSAQ